MGVMDRIQALCRNFLWEGHGSYSKAPLVVWNVLCTSKDKGGLGLTDSKLWNIAAIGKLIWWLASKQDHLWIRWVNCIYIKGMPWKDYEPTPYSSWAWRKICEVKKLFKVGYTDDKWRGTDVAYTISDGYNWLLNETTQKFPWARIVWNRYNLPKWSFIMWLIQHHRLLTLDRLRKMGLDVPTDCYLCGMEAETHTHIFRTCIYITRCFQLLSSWLQIPVGILLATECILKLRRFSMLVRQIILAAIVGVHYGVWKSRNTGRVDGYVMNPVHLVRLVQVDCRRRVAGEFQGSMTNFDKTWCRDHGLI
ncbi:uncharacterized protein LOC141588156 [Silene latifolia]|uniref:uncharacterized protein LOC141588156 n=1 Tax=Silene latifolia TaxID=37657 RepID=UPI003D782017